MFVCQSFLSQILAIHRTAGEGKRPYFKPFCHFHQFTNIHTFICVFSYEIRIFSRTVCIDQTATRWYLTHYWITIWLIDHAMLIFVCLLDNWILEFCLNNLRQKTGEFQLPSIMTHSIIYTRLYPLQATRLTKCSSQP